MCGRYKRRSDKQHIAEAFQVSVGLEELYLGPEDDIAPQSFQPVIHLNEDGERQIELMRWAFKLPDRLLFNARSEGIEDANFWKESFIERRCIVPGDAVFEWQDVKNGKKPKYEFTLPGKEPFGMAAVWKLWKHPKTNQWERTFAVLTGEPNGLMEPIHPRMTTFLEPRDYPEYLAPAERLHARGCKAATGIYALPESRLQLLVRSRYTEPSQLSGVCETLLNFGGLVL
jgi:putative SOS response-associated peptidase YedK